MFLSCLLPLLIMKIPLKMIYAKILNFCAKIVMGKITFLLLPIIVNHNSSADCSL